MSNQCPHCKELSPDNFEKCQWCAKRFDEPVANITEESLQSKNPIATKTDDTMQKKTFGLGSIMLSISGWLWLVVCFTAKEAKWWNSLWFFLLIFIFAISLGIIGRRSIGGILGIIVGGLGLLVVTFGLYVG
ncbi:MAG: hypothetical protein WC947_10265 [Elusimicrobiota bacterium]